MVLYFSFFLSERTSSQNGNYMTCSSADIRIIIDFWSLSFISQKTPELIFFSCDIIGATVSVVQCIMSRLDSLEMFAQTHYFVFSVILLLSLVVASDIYQEPSRLT